MGFREVDVVQVLTAVIAAPEEVLAALVVEQRCALATDRLLAALVKDAGPTGVTDGSAAYAPYAGTRGGYAARFPAGSALLAVTDRRVAAVTADDLASGGVTCSYALDLVRLVRNVDRGSCRRLTLAFADGTGVLLDCRRGQSFGRFASSLSTDSAPAVVVPMHCPTGRR